MQSTNSILMMRPCRFGYNSQTAESNSFQHASPVNDPQVQNRSLREFNLFVEVLSHSGVDVQVFNDTPLPHTPDSIFPNNWFSTHEDGSIVIYPMAHENRRAEVRSDVLDALANRAIRVHGKAEIIDLRLDCAPDAFLEGTGSLVLDRVHRIAYVARGPRSNSSIVERFCAKLGYTALLFDPISIDGKAIYHTNVLMSVGSTLAIVCFDAVASESDRRALRHSLEQSGHEILDISYEQLTRFAGNMIELRDGRGNPLWVCSSRALGSLSPAQRTLLERHGQVIHSDLRTIEDHGGGSARCMIAELF